VESFSSVFHVTRDIACNLIVLLTFYNKVIKRNDNANSDDDDDDDAAAEGGRA